MKTCLNCRAVISETFTHCPICGARRCDKINAVIPVYPTYIKSNVTLAQIRKWTSTILFFATLGTVIINIILGGSLWSAYVVISSYLCHKIFLSEQLIDTSRIKKWMSIVSTICIFFLTVQFLAGAETFIAYQWRYIIVVILNVSLLSCMTLYLYDFQVKKFNLWAEVKKKACIY